MRENGGGVLVIGFVLNACLKAGGGTANTLGGPTVANNKFE